MGYRSDIKVIMYATTYEKLGVLRVWWEGVKESGNEDALSGFRFEEGFGVVFEGESVKWYDSYADVQWAEHVFTEFCDTFINSDKARPLPPGVGCGYGFEYIRVGENDDDVETLCDGDVQWHISLQRAISIDLPPTLTAKEK